MEPLQQPHHQQQQRQQQQPRHRPHRDHCQHRNNGASGSCTDGGGRRGHFDQPPLRSPSQQQQPPVVDEVDEARHQRHHLHRQAKKSSSVKLSRGPQHHPPPRHQLSEPVGIGQHSMAMLVAQQQQQQQQVQQHHHLLQRQQAQQDYPTHLVPSPSPTASSLIAPPPPAPGSPAKPSPPLPLSPTAAATEEMNRLNLSHHTLPLPARQQHLMLHPHLHRTSPPVLQPPPVCHLGEALVRMGNSVALSVEMLSALGEAIGDENGDIREEMQTACREARTVSAGLEKLCQTVSAHLAASEEVLVVPRNQGVPGNMDEPGGPSAMDFTNSSGPEALACTVKCQLATVTRILLLADNVVVRQLLTQAVAEKQQVGQQQAQQQQGQQQAEKQVSTSVASSKSVGGTTSTSTLHHFTEFVKAFCDFGFDLIHMAHVISGNDNHAREDHRQTQLDCARVVLNRSSTLLLSSSEVFLHHQHANTTVAAVARKNRDAVFCQMRRALDLVHFMARESVVDAADSHGQDGGGGVSAGMDFKGSDKFGFHGGAGSDDSGTTANGDRSSFDTTVLTSIRQFEESVAIMRASPVSEGYKEQLASSLASITERMQDFTDSAYTSHEHRQNILLHCDRAKVELLHLLRSMDSHHPHHHHHSSTDTEGRSAEGDITPFPHQQQGVEQAIRNLVKATEELVVELQQTAVENAVLFEQNCQVGSDRLMVLQECALMGDDERLGAQAERFSSEHLDYAEDVSKLLHHVASDDSMQIRARHAQINLRIYGPQVGVAAAALCQNPRSKVSKANLENFCAMWKHLTEDVLIIAQAVREECEKNKRKQQQQQQPPQSILLNPPVILKHPPTPGSQSASFPPSSIEFPPHSPDQHHHHNQLSVSQSDSSLGKLHKSVPNLSITREEDQFLPSDMGDRGGGGDGFLDPHQLMMEPRRHSTSSVMPGQYPAKGTSMGMIGMMPGGAFHSGEFVSPEELLNSFKDVDNNEIINRAKKMVGQARDMLDFTRSCSDKVRTTQDLFTLAEFFAQEANLLYKVIRLFSYDVPSGEDKRSLMATADHIPKHCQQMQMLIQSPTVGKAAIFTKVDSIIKEARQIVLLIAQVAQICYANANKYNLDFSNISADAKAGGGGSASSDEAFGGSGSAGDSS